MDTFRPEPIDLENRAEKMLALIRDTRVHALHVEAYNAAAELRELAAEIFRECEHRYVESIKLR
jgi:hypothetical protein